MRAAILAVGSELLGTDRLDTNSLRITATLRRFGVDLVAKRVVGDLLDPIAAEIGELLGRCDLLVVTGGLGPTEDDLTREAVARALGRDLERSEELVEGIRAGFRTFGIDMPDVNRKQGDVIAGGVPLANSRGSAPGQVVEAAGKAIFLFPGVPTELEGMIETALEPWLAERGGAEEVETWLLRVACLPESTVEQRILPVYEEFGREGISILPNPGEVLVRVTLAGAAEDRRRRLTERIERLAELIGDAVYSRDPGGSLESAVGGLLAGAGRTAATAESCTGGLIAERLTRVPGSSAYFIGGVVSYSNRAKTEMLGVPEASIERHGAVSEEVVRAMAAGALAAFGADYSIAVSGVAGPGGGSAEKPVGTVHIAVAGPPDGQVTHRLRRFPGDRERVRRMASQWGLELLRRRLLEP